MFRSLLRGRARSLVVVPALAALLALGAGSAFAATTNGGTYVFTRQPYVGSGCLFIQSYPGGGNLYYCLSTS